MSPNDQAVIPYPNYTLYETLCQSYGIKYNYIQSDENFIISFKSLNQKPSQAIFFSLIHEVIRLKIQCYPGVEQSAFFPSEIF